ncbi:PEP-CTERM sorting domain-containing protein [Microcoleus vaginatus GB1-A2]|uniref:PEP-CTERM sorting domain-containing protein n=1 Tax=Microcoleus vaginatus TaxID=119532 RepID=UPI0016865D9A|nr:PEP-CTERM sorting domain-containing protein [Microcoleus sp. FACHB-61]
MCTPLAKLAIGLSATMATAFYYLAAAPPASAQSLPPVTHVCGPGNFSNECGGGQVRSEQSAGTSSQGSVRNPGRNEVQEAPVESPSPVAPDLVEEAPQPIAPDLVEEAPDAVASPGPLWVEPQLSPDAVASPEPSFVEESVESVPAVAPPAPTPDLVPEVPPTAPPVTTTPALNFANIYATPTPVRTKPIPEPGTVVALLVTGAGIICSGRKRNKQVGQQR